MDGLSNSRGSPLSDQDLHDGAAEESGPFASRIWSMNKAKKKLE